MTNSIEFQERRQCPKIVIKKKINQTFHVTTVANDLLFVLFVIKWYHLVKLLMRLCHIIYVFKCDTGQDELHCYFGNNVWHIWHNQITQRKFATSCRISHNGSGNKMKICALLGIDTWNIIVYNGTMNKMAFQCQKVSWFYLSESISDIRKKK